MAGEIFAAVWLDSLCGPLTLQKPNAAEAISAALSIREKGGDKVRHVRAVRLTVDNEIIDLLPA